MFRFANAVVAAGFVIVECQAAPKRGNFFPHERMYGVWGGMGGMQMRRGGEMGGPPGIMGGGGATIIKYY